ncbi:MAG: hypothetical protein AAF567_16090 [Actinomycetota bacterium]
MRRSRIVAVVLFVLLVLAACGGGSEPTSAVGSDDADNRSGEVEATVPETTEEAEEADAAPDDVSASAEPSVSTERDEDPAADGPSDDVTSAEPAPPGARSELAESVADAEDPLAALLGFDSFEDPAFILEQQRRVDALVQECMLAEGFEYAPQDIDADLLAFGRSIAPNLTDEEFAAAYGYGIVASANQLLALLNASVDNPNAAMFRAMSEAERDAWVFALLGPGVEIDVETGALVDPESGEELDPTQLAFRGTGCASQANQEIFGSLQALIALTPRLEELTDRIEADPRIVEITAAWSSCMAESGFEYRSLAEPADEFSFEVNRIVGPLLQQANAATFSGDVEPLAFSPEEVERLDTLLVDEIAAATVDHACVDPFRDELMTIDRSYELDFIDENAGVLADVAG